MNPLHLLSAGAAQALATGMQARFLQLHGQAVAPTFGAVGVMKDKLLAGAPCDVMILTDALINQLTSGGHLRAGSARPLGVVKTGVAVKSGQARLAAHCKRLEQLRDLQQRRGRQAGGACRQLLLLDWHMP
jgi:molybdate transport system substrate-binding protein